MPSAATKRATPTSGGRRSKRPRECDRSVTEHRASNTSAESAIGLSSNEQLKEVRVRTSSMRWLSVTLVLLAPLVVLANGPNDKATAAPPSEVMQLLEEGSKQYLQHHFAEAI